jgi:Nif-specific regulatory protein
MNSKIDNKLMNYQVTEIIDLLHDVSQSLNSGENFDVLIKPVLHLMREHLGLRSGMLTIFNRATGSIFIEESFGLQDKTNAEYKIGEGIIGEVVESGTSLIVQDASKDSRFLNKTGSLMHRSSFISVPIIYGHDVLGTLSAFRDWEEALELEYDAKLLEILAAMIARTVRLHRSIHEENFKLQAENQRLQTQITSNYKPESIIGNSKNMREVFHMVNKVAATDTTALLLGESGVGKELIAKEIFSESKRNDKPYLRFNCAAIPEGMVESELFGHEKGAFTGAHQKRLGLFLAAEGGTIFLDEIGELTPAVQTKLLRVLQEREFQAVGSDRTQTCDVRIIAATNRNLEKEVEKGTFREDLYYRLNVFPITIPSLKDRKTDIPLLTDYFIKKYSEQNLKEVVRISTPAIDMLMSYHWPGNVRELENCIERAVILCEGDTIHGYDLPPTLQTGHELTTHFNQNFEQTIETLEREMIVDALKNANGNARTAAGVLGISYRKLGLRLEKYHIDFRAYRNPHRS